ncbi:hypothetical protein ACFX2B_014459 [Malus domestica]
MHFSTGLDSLSLSFSRYGVAQLLGVTKIVGDAESEPIVVKKNCIEILIEELGGDGAFELVEAEIQVLEGRQRQHYFVTQ